jgi:hypothetical protein
VAAGSKEVAMAGVELRSGAGRLEAELRVGDRTLGVQYVDVRNA